MSKIQQAKQCRFRDTVLFEHSRYSILNYVKKLWLTNLCTWSAARHYNTAVMNCVHLRLCICRPLKNLQAHNSRHNNVQCSGAVSLCCPYSVWSWLWTITFMLPKSTEPKIRLDWTRRASVDGYTSACCDLDFLTLWRQKLIIISMSPLTSVTNIWWNFLHRFLRHGIHKVFGTYRLTPLRPNSQTNRPEYSMPPAPFFNGGGVIINTKMKFRKVSSVILTCAVVRDGCLIGNISTSWTPSIFNACGALLVLDSGTKLFKLIAGATLTSLRLYRGHRHSYAKSDMSSECFLTNLPSFIRRTAPWQRPKDGHFSHASAGIWNIVRDLAQQQCIWPVHFPWLRLQELVSNESKRSSILDLRKGERVCVRSIHIHIWSQLLTDHNKQARVGHASGSSAAWVGSDWVTKLARVHGSGSLLKASFRIYNT